MCRHERAQILTVEVFPAPTVFFFCVTSAKWVCEEEEEASNADQWICVSGNPGIAFLYTTGNNSNKSFW